MYKVFYKAMTAVSPPPNSWGGDMSLYEAGEQDLQYHLNPTIWLSKLTHE